MKAAEADDDRAFASLFMTALPRKDPGLRADPWHWQQSIEAGTYFFESGAFPQGTPIGIPYGSKARLILIFLVTQSVKAGSPVVNIGSSLYGWVRATSTAQLGGMTYRMIVDQARRISACRMGADMLGEAQAGLLVNGVATGEHDELIQRLREGWLNPDPVYLKDVRTIQFPSKAVLGDALLSTFQNDPIALSVSALARIGDNSVAIDMYIWLAARLPLITQPCLVDWHDLIGWFAPAYAQRRQAKAAILGALRLCLAVYPQARVEEAPVGLILYRSPGPLHGAGCA